jgi:hypothetical protein
MYYLILNIIEGNTTFLNINIKKYSIILNLIIFIFNFYLLFERKIIKNEEKYEIKIKFKSADNFLNLFSKTYEQISNYLNMKYNIFNETSKNRKIYKKKISLYSVDLFSPKFHKLWIYRKLKKKFRIKFDKNNPDYLIYNIFGDEHLNQKYKNSIKIAIFTENKIPDLSEVDYAIGQAHINYLDRYFKFPIFFWFINKKYKNIREKLLNNPKRTKFCAAVISHGGEDKFRTIFINELNKYKKVDMGGKFLNNVGGPVKDKIKFLSSYKFSIAMENSEGDGYLSEKIIDSFISGTIPIYYGDYTLDEFINPKAFILIKNEKNINEKIEYIKEIDNNNEKYSNILKENLLIDENIIDKIEKEENKFLYNIFQQEKLKSRRIHN